MLVISRYTFNTPGSIALNKTLEDEEGSNEKPASAPASPAAPPNSTSTAR